MRRDLISPTEYINHCGVGHKKPASYFDRCGFLNARLRSFELSPKNLLQALLLSGQGCDAEQAKGSDNSQNVIWIRLN